MSRHFPCYLLRVLKDGKHGAFLVIQTVKNPPANAGDSGSIPGSGRSPEGRHGNPLQYSCLGNPMDRDAWQATVHGVAKNQTRLKRLSSSSSFLSGASPQSGKESTCNVGGTENVGSIIGSGRSPGEGNGNPLQYSCLENSMDRDAWWATVHRVTKSWT